MTPMRKYNNQNWLPSIFNDFFDNDWMVRTNATAPAINVIENENDYKVEVAAPGMTKEDFNVHLGEDNELVITMEKKNETKDEGNKKYKTLEGAKKYIQSKFDKYADLFETLSPPVPKEAKHLFCVNGQVLQGYSIMRPAPKKEKVTLDDLLDCLEDQDLDDIPLEQATPIGAKAPVKPPGERPNEPPKGQKAPLSKAAPAKKKAPAKKRPAQVR